jgi:hypothetical protein
MEGGKIKQKKGKTRLGYNSVVEHLPKYIHKMSSFFVVDWCLLIER